jgi:hypothetical protein
LLQLPALTKRRRNIIGESGRRKESKNLYILMFVLFQKVHFKEGRLSLKITLHSLGATKKQAKKRMKEKIFALDAEKVGKKRIKKLNS